VSNLYYKTGDTDDRGAVLLHNGVGIDLTGYTVVFVLSDGHDIRFEVPCTLGGTVNGVDALAANGGITINFSTDYTGTAGTYYGEFVATIGTNVIHIPPDNNYTIVTIMEAL